MSQQVIRLTKIEAAERQLREAINLFAEGRDPVAVHTLGGSAHQILNDLAKQKDFVSLIRDNPCLRPEKKTEWISIVNRAQNFFKHADRDADVILDFNTEATRFFLFDAIEMYFALKQSWFLEGFVFRAWICVNYPQFFLGETRRLFEDFAQQLGTQVSDFGKALEVVKDVGRPN